MSNTRSARIAYPIVSVTIAFIILLLNGVIAQPHPARTATLEALKWTRVSLPAEGAAGGWELASGSDIQLLTAAGDGTLYAYVTGLTYTLYKSTDGGLKWSYIGSVQHAITDIAVPPDNTSVIYYSTASAVYRSGDGGKNFIPLPASPGGAGANNIEITSIAATRLNSNTVAVGTRDKDSSGFGGVYVMDEGDIIPNWADTGVAGYDVYALAFSPNYSEDRQIIAVATDETDTYVFNKIGNADWNAFLGAAKLNRNNTLAPTPVTVNGTAVISFPRSYNADTASGNNYFFAGINTGNDEGDVYKITWRDAPDSSMATDLNCGSQVDIDIAGLTVYSDSTSVLLLAGAADGCRIYYSTDSGNTWQRSKKDPTGAAATGVLIAADFNASGTIYAATSGNGSAVSVSRDLGLSWNQVSLIDTTITDIIDIAPSPEASLSNTLFVLTYGDECGLWRSADDGCTFERILAGSSAGVDSLALVSLSPQYGVDGFTVYAAGVSNGRAAIWESDDNGQSYRCRVTHEGYTGASFSIDAWAINGENTIYIGSYDGAQGKIYRTTDGGYSYSEGTPAGEFPFYSLALSPDFENDGAILAGNSDGWIYYSGDYGASFQPLPGESAAAPLGGAIAVAFDAAFKTNHTVYAAGDNVDGGLYRFVIGYSDDWEAIDTTLPAGAIINRLAITDSGVLYAANKDPDGGMERCLNPGLTSGAAFETVTLGLSDGAALSGLWQRGNQLWSIDIANGRLMTYRDTLTQSAQQISPEDKISGIGRLGDHSVRDITIDWEAMDGATSYEWECSYNTNYSDIPAGLSGTTSATSVRLPTLEPATAYYWRVRACAPVCSPWSPGRSFITSMDIESVNLIPETPESGAAGVSVKPIFQWTAVIGAEFYDLLVAADADFSHPVIVRINEYSLENNVWQCDVSLDYDTTYYWKVRATTADTQSVWSSSSIFTTESAPPVEESPPPEEPATTPPSEDTISELSVPRSIQSTQPPLLTVTHPADKITVTPVLAPATTPAPTTTVNHLLELPEWMIYLIGGLLAIVFLSLIIVLAVVLKIKRF